MNKLFSALTVASLLVSGAAFAEEAKTEATPVVASETATPAVTSTELADGTKIEIDGDKVSVVAADGTKTPAPDGTHTLKDGTTVTTKAGVVVKE